MKESKLYSYTLVTVQFMCIILLLGVTESVVHKPYSLALMILGFCFGFYTVAHNRVNNFNIIPDIKEGATLITTGAYKFVRHPMYFAVLVIMGATIIEELSFLTLAIYVVLMGVLILKAKKEERLWSEKSSKYQEYMKKTKMIIPFLF